MPASVPFSHLSALEDRRAFEHDLEFGRGGIWLNLTLEQYAICLSGKALSSEGRSAPGLRRSECGFCGEILYWHGHNYPREEAVL